mgnify:CR=1 FL=1
MGGLRDYSVSAAFIGVAVAILLIAAEIPYGPVTLHAQISVVPVGKGVVKCYRAENAHLPEIAIYVNLSNTKSSPVYVTSVYVNGVPVNITSIANVYNGSKPEAFNSTRPDLVPIEPGLNHLTISGVLVRNLNSSNGALVLVQLMLSDGEMSFVPSTLEVTGA